jgi:hypothetical protein
LDTVLADTPAMRARLAARGLLLSLRIDDAAARAAVFGPDGAP